jgi:hypothetical protein
MTRMCRNKITSRILHASEARSLTLSEEVLEGNVLRDLSASDEVETNEQVKISRNEELCDLHRTTGVASTAKCKKP